MPHARSNVTYVAAELHSWGFTSQVARLAAGVLCDSDMVGRVEHGTAVLPEVLANLKSGKIRADHRLSLYSTESVLIGIDANNTLGYAAAATATRLATRVAMRRGASAFVMRNVDHIGAAGVYARRAAERACVALITCAGKPRIASWRGSTPLFGTTPVAIGIPTPHEPYIIDSCLAKITALEVKRRAASEGRLPARYAYDSQGRPTTDPKKALKGSIRAIGGHRGAALAAAVHVACHALGAVKGGDHPAVGVFLYLGHTSDAAARAGQIVEQIARVAVAESGRAAGDSYRPRGVVTL